MQTKSAQQAQPETSDAGLLTRDGLAAALQVSVRTVDRMLANAEIPYLKVGAQVRFSLPEVIARLRRGNGQPGGPGETPPPGSPTQ